MGVKLFFSYLWIEFVKISYSRYLIFLTAGFIIIPFLILKQFQSSVLDDYQAYQMYTLNLELEDYFIMKLSQRIHFILFIILFTVTLVAIEIDVQANFINSSVRKIPIVMWLYILIKSIIIATITTLVSIAFYLFMPNIVKAFPVNTDVVCERLCKGNLTFIYGASLALFYIPMSLFFLFLSIFFRFKLIPALLCFFLIFTLAKFFSFPNPLTTFQKIDFDRNPFANSTDIFICVISTLLLLFINAYWLKKGYV